MTSPATFYATEPTGSQAYGAPRDGGKRSHTGDDFSHSTRANTIDVPAIRAGVVVDVQHDGPNLGNGYGNQVCVLHADRSMFSYSHLGRIAVAEGQTVEAGTIVGTEGTTGWTDGPCVHVEYFDARGRRLDPYPHIRDALVTTAGMTATTTTREPEPEEDDDMLALEIKYGSARHYATLTTGVFRHLVRGDDPDRVRDIVRARDDWQSINLVELPIYLRTYGCDLNIWDLRTADGISTTADTGQFTVLDPLTGAVKSGGMWSAVNAARAENRGIKQAVIDLTAILAAAKADAA